MESENAFVYMIRCAGGQLYCGWSNDPQRRLHQHKAGTGAKSTRGFHAQKIVYLERCADKSAALRRESEIKRLTKPKKEALCAAWAEENRPRLSLAERKDAADIVELYNWYVCNHTATFQITPSTEEEYSQWIEQTLTRAPLLLARDGKGRLLGYACAHRWHEREAFLWDMESTVYCAPAARSLGVAKILYETLLDCLTAQGYWNVYALVTDPNPASERFHQKLGFTCVGREERTAYKFGHWLGLSTWHKSLHKGRSAPQPPRLTLPPEELAEILRRHQP